jgi:hypothetical protein
MVVIVFNATTIELNEWFPAVHIVTRNWPPREEIRACKKARDAALPL